MTHDELKAELPRRPESDVQKWAMEAWQFQNNFDTKPSDKPGYEKVITRAFLHHNATYEIIICAHLDVATQADRTLEANVGAAKSARISKICAAIAVVISLLTFFDSKYGFIPMPSRGSAQRTEAIEEVAEDADTLSSGGEQPASQQDRDADGGQADASEDRQATQPEETDQGGQD
jgi:hypothetical protein